MYTISKNAQITLALLKAHNIKHIVINPGTTNMPIIRGVQNDTFFKCYSVVDERSAMYFAIGLHLQTGERIAITCTSAQATRNYIPGLTEAFYKHTPILAITTSKLPHQTGQEYMQGPNQASLPVDAVKQTFACPYVTNKYDEIHCARLVNEAILEITHRIPGPVQLNLPMNDGEMGKFTEPELPKVKVINRYMEWDEWDAPLKNKKIMLVIGEHRPFTKQQITLIETFADSYNVFIYVNHLSNYHGKYAVLANLSLYGLDNNVFRKTYKPDILITIGGQTGDYPLFGKLAGGNEFDFEHWRVSEDGNVVDTYNKLTKVFECPFELFFIRLTEKNTDGHSYYELWKKLSDSTNIPENLPFSNAYLAQQLYNILPSNSYLHLAILNSLRIWSFFPLDNTIICYSNVAAFGIDGCMSVFLGQSIATDKLCFLVVGDLSFFYDMNSLGIRHIKNNVRILLVNNGCGAEFKLFWHPCHQFGNETDLYTAAAGHNGNGAKGWAEANNFKYLSAKTKEEFLQYKDEFTSISELPIVFEVFTKSEDESDALRMIKENNQIIDNSATSVLKRNLAPALKNTIKRIVGK